MKIRRVVTSRREYVILNDDRWIDAQAWDAFVENAKAIGIEPTEDAFVRWRSVCNRLRDERVSGVDLGK